MRLKQLEEQVPEVLAELESFWPTWELNINRHMVIHLAEAVRRHGPCWAWSMFGFERLWGRLSLSETQTSHPEATMVNAWKAFITCCVARPEMATELHSISWNLVVPPQHPSLPTTFDRAVYELKLPSFMQSSVSTPITLSA